MSNSFLLLNRGDPLCDQRVEKNTLVVITQSVWITKFLNWETPVIGAETVDEAVRTVLKRRIDLSKMDFVILGTLNGHLGMINEIHVKIKPPADSIA